MGFFSSLFGSSPKTTTSTQTTQVDPRWQAYLDAYQQHAMGVAGQGPSPYTTQSAGYYNQLAGMLPFGMQTGAAGVDAYMNPYIKNVIDAMNPVFAQQRAAAGNAAADQSIADGSFGGSRSAVLQAQLLRDINQNQTGTVAGLQSQGYTQALQALLQDRGMALNAGQFGVQGLANTGQYMDARQVAMMQPWLASLGFGQNPTTKTVTTEKGGGGGIFQKLVGAGLTLAAPFTGGATLGPGVSMLSGGGDPLGGYNPFAKTGGGPSATNAGWGAPSWQPGQFGNPYQGQQDPWGVTHP